MDKRTIFAIVISAVIFLGYILISNVFFGKPKEKPAVATEQPQPKPVEQVTTVSAITAVPFDRQVTEETKLLESDIFRITFSNRGGVATSIKLNDPEKDPGNKNTDDDIEMIYASMLESPAKDTKDFENPFALSFGTYKTAPVNDLFEIRQPVYNNDDPEKKIKKGDPIKNQIEFTRDFELEGKRFKVTKLFELVQDQYLLKLVIRLDSLRFNVKPEENYLPLKFYDPEKKSSSDFDAVFYTLGIGPQIGPKFEPPKPDDRSEYRKFVYLNNRGRNEQGLQRGDKPMIISGGFSWAAIMGKYYTLIGSTDDAMMKNLVLDAREINLPYLRSAMYFERKYEQTSNKTDHYTFFIGPKKRDVLAKYPEANYSEIAPVHFPFGTIAEILKYPLDFFAKVGNYGVAIIFLTILIKLLFYPLTRKGYASMKKMQALNPKLQELRARYKADPKRLNAEMGELYRKEGVSPLGGCLPQLLQLPIMFALYVLFNEHFALKNAIFIPGWISDLSVAESIAKLPFTIPLLGWSYIRLLPIIMLATQLVSTFFTQAQSTSGDSKMKYLPYILMGVFFFILYDLPSGLVLYWTVQNILTVLQLVIQKFFSEHKLNVKSVQS